MGDMADDLYDLREAEEHRLWEIQSYYQNKTDAEIKEIISNLLKEDFYRKDSYTSMMENIIQYKQISKKQRNALIVHLAIHTYDGECEIDCDE